MTLRENLATVSVHNEKSARLKMNNNTINSDDWDLLELELDELLALPANMREQRLMEIAQTRPNDVTKLREWLEGIETPDGFLDVVENKTRLNPEPGQLLGPWRLVRRIAEGGMGSVWLAERADGSFTKHVAIKFLREDSPQLRERLVQERQVLARLDHPGIARLLDGGTTPEGVGYLVAEYVDGLALDAWCEQNQPSLVVRIDLFCQIASAVAYAHSSLIVHRDLKPRNIMVDREGRTRLLDFGIAKLVDPTNVVETADRALTPEFAAPEQLTGAAITTRTDVYALGALLYFLLTGQAPLALRGLPLAVLVRRVCDDMPAAPSTLAQTKIAVAAVLRGDLDAISLKALAKEPDRRYASVEAMLADIDAWRRHLPVSARASSTWYRLRRFARRHWIVLSASAVVTFALVGGLLVSLWFLKAALIQEEAVQRDSARLVALRDFMLRLLRQEKSDAKVDVADLLAHAEAGIGPDSGIATEARALAAIEVIRLYITRRDTASTLRALGLVADIDTKALVDDMAAELDCLRAEALHFSHDNQTAKRFVQTGIERAQRIEGARRHILAQCLNNRAAIAFDLHDPQSAISDYQSALVTMEEMNSILKGQVSTFMPDQIASILDNLGGVLVSTNRFQEAEEAYRKALKLLEQIHQDQGPEAAAVLGNLAILYKISGRPRDALPFFEKALALRREILGASSRLAQQLINVAGAYDVLGESEHSLSLLDEAEQMQRPLVAPVSMHYAQLHLERGRALMHLNRLDAAKSEFAKTHELYQQLLPPEHEFQQLLRNDEAELALMKPDNGAQLDRVSANLAGDIERMRKPDASAKGALARALTLAAQAAFLRNDMENAARLAHESRDEYVAMNGESAWQIANCDWLLGRIALARGDRKAARELLKAAADSLAKALGPDHSLTRSARESLVAIGNAP